MDVPAPRSAPRQRGRTFAALGVGALAALVSGAWLVGRRRQPAVEAHTRARLARVDPGRA